MKLSVVIPVVLPSLAYGQNNGALSGLRNDSCSGITENCGDTDGCQLNTGSVECEFFSCTGMGEGLCRGETSCTWDGSNCSFLTCNDFTNPTDCAAQPRCAWRDEDAQEIYLTEPFCECKLDQLDGCTFGKFKETEQGNYIHSLQCLDSNITHDNLAACLNDAHTDELTLMRFNFRRSSQATFGVFGAGFNKLPALRELKIEAIESLKIIDLAGFSSLLSNDDFEIIVQDCRELEGVINIPTSISNSSTSTLMIRGAPNACTEGSKGWDSGSSSCSTSRATAAAILADQHQTVQRGQQCGGTVDSLCGVDAQCRDCAESGEGCAIQSGDPSDWKCTAPVSDGQKCGGTTTCGKDAACLQCSEDDSFCIPEDSFGTPDRDWICTKDIPVQPEGVCGGIAECEAGIECRRCAQVVIDGFTFDGVCVPSSADLTNDWTCTHPVVGQECQELEPEKCKVELLNEAFCTPVSSEGSAWECQRPDPVDPYKFCGGTQFCNGAAIQCIGCSSQFQCQPHSDQVWICQPPPNNVSP